MPKVNNEIYDELGEKWYHAYNDPVALLRAESKLRNPWVEQTIASNLGSNTGNIKVLDVGCGAGFLSNYLGVKGYQVHGIDLSEQSLKVAHDHDVTKSVVYSKSDASQLPYEDNSFDVVAAMDFLEHVEQPERFILEMSRVLRPQGLFFFHTFNRNFLSWLIVIKAVELFVQNTPRHMHVLDLFITPEEITQFCLRAHLEVKEIKGVKPELFKLGTLKSFLKRRVPEDLEFRFTKSLNTAYSGYALKVLNPGLAN